MKRSRVARTRWGFRLGLRAAACLLLALIAADLVADGACDSCGFAATATTTLRRAAPDGATEPCAEFCVPDCFCCSCSVVAAPVVLPSEPECLDSVGAPVAKRWTEGVRPVVDRPPLARV